MVSDGLILEHTPSKAFRTKAQNAVHGIFNPLSQCQRTIITRHAVVSTGGILFLIEDFLMGTVNMGTVNMGTVNPVDLSAFAARAAPDTALAQRSSHGRTTRSP